MTKLTDNTDTNEIEELDEDDSILYQDLFSGKKTVALVGVNPWSTQLWNRGKWEPVLGKQCLDNIEGCGVYRLTHEDFVAICEAICNERHALNDPPTNPNDWDYSPRSIARACDKVGAGSRWFRMSDAFTKWVGQATPITTLADFID